jgi:hypothetical protein
MLNTARTTATENRTQPLWPVIPTPLQRQKSRPSIRRARVIQICQKLDAQRNLLADGLAVSSPGISIDERLIKNSVVRCATTLYALLVLELNATTRLAIRSEESPPPTACTCCWPSPVRVPSLGFSSPLSYAVEPNGPAKLYARGLTGSKNVRGHRRCHFQQRHQQGTRFAVCTYPTST